MTEVDERREYGEQLFTALALLKLLKAEGNPAAELLVYDIKCASTARTVRDMNAWWQTKPLVPLDSVAWFRKGMARKSRILGPLI